MRRILWGLIRALFLAFLLLVPLYAEALAAAIDPPAQAFVDRETRLLWLADAAYVSSAGFSQRTILSRSRAAEFIRAMNQGFIENFGLRGWRLASSEELESIYRTYASQPEASRIRNFAAFRSYMEADPTPRLWTHRRLSNDRVFVWPVLALSVPEGFDELAIFATNSIRVEQGSVVTGDIKVNGASSGAVLYPGFELRLSRGGSVVGDVSADSVMLEQNLSISGLVSYNQLTNNGNSVSTQTPLGLPVFEEIPPFQVASIRVGAEDVAVPSGGTSTLPPGDYFDITIAPGGTVVFKGGVYNVGSIMAVPGGKCSTPCRSLEFEAPSEVRVQGRVELGQDAFIGPANEGTASASTVIFYIGATNLDPEDPLSLPAMAIGQSSEIQANLWTIDGTLLIEKNASVIGALFGRDVYVHRDSSVTRSNYFNPPPTADPQDVFTNDTDPLVITLTGSDPNGEPLDFSLVSGSGASLGTLGGVTPLTASSAEVTYAANQPGNLFDSFVFQVTDPNGGTDRATVSINPDDVPPVVEPANNVLGKDQTVEVQQDTSLDIILVGFPDVAQPELIGDLEFSILSGPSHGSATVPAPIVPVDLSAVRSATTTYAPGNGYTGDDSFTFEVCGDLTMDGDTDDFGECDQAIVSISVQAEAEAAPPIAQNFTVTSPVDITLTINLSKGSTTAIPQPGDDHPASGPEAFPAGALPNLTIESFAAPTSASPGEVVGDRIMVKLTNTGTAAIPAGTLAAIGFYISTDSTITTDDSLLIGGRENLASSAPDGLLPGESIEDFLFAGASIPSGSPTGSVFIGVLADEFDDLAESSETDNTASQAMFIGAPAADLVVSLTHDPISPQTETQIDFTATVSNIGTDSAGPSTLCFDIAGEDCNSSAPIFNIPALAPTEMFSVVRSLTLLAGSYQNLAIADFGGDVAESDEDNNTATDTFAVSEGPVSRLVANILTLPSSGTLRDSSGTVITSPTTLLDTTVVFVPAPGFIGTVSFSFSLTDTLTARTSVAATVGLVYSALNCQIDKIYCDDGRP